MSLTGLWNNDMNNRMQSGFMRDKGQRQRLIIVNLRKFLKHDIANRVTKKDLLDWRDIFDANTFRQNRKRDMPVCSEGGVHLGEREMICHYKQICCCPIRTALSWNVMLSSRTVSSNFKTPRDERRHQLLGIFQSS